MNKFSSYPGLFLLFVWLTVLHDEAEFFKCSVLGILQPRANSDKVKSVLKLFSAEFAGRIHITLIKPDKIGL